jgi:hypothetical protein
MKGESTERYDIVTDCKFWSFVDDRCLFDKRKSVGEGLIIGYENLKTKKIVISNAER